MGELSDESGLIKYNGWRGSPPYEITYYVISEKGRAALGVEEGRAC